MNAAALPASAGMPPSRRLWTALGLSLALHTVALTLHFKFPEASRQLREKAMDIVLVNAKSANKPTDAQVLGQANLDSGGNTDEDRRAKTPLPPTPHQVAGNDIEHVQRRIHELEAQQRKMLTQAKSVPTPSAPTNSQPQPLPAKVSGFDLAESARAMARLEGEIDKSVDDYSKRPRKKFVGLRAEEYRFTQYIEDWRQKVERVGTLNYPDAARGKLYGSLVLTVSIRPDGSVADIEINKSSGHKVLDEAARRIVNLAAPYSAFPPDIRRDTDLLVITRAWTFTRNSNLETRAQ